MHSASRPTGKEATDDSGDEDDAPYYNLVHDTKQNKSSKHPMETSAGRCSVRFINDGNIRARVDFFHRVLSKTSVSLVAVSVVYDQNTREMSVPILSVAVEQTASCWLERH